MTAVNDWQVMNHGYLQRLLAEVIGVEKTGGHFNGRVFPGTGRSRMERFFGIFDWGGL